MGDPLQTGVLLLPAAVVSAFYEHQGCLLRPALITKGVSPGSHTLSVCLFRLFHRGLSTTALCTDRSRFLTSVDQALRHQHIHTQGQGGSGQH